MGVFDGSIGAFVIGTILSTFLLGVTATQAWNYFVAFPNDKRMYWWLVIVLCVFDWTHTTVSCYTIYLWTVTDFAQPMLLSDCPWSFAVDPMMTGIVACVCQLFYAYRVYLWPSFPADFSFGARADTILAAFALASTVWIFQLVQFVRFPEKTWGVLIWLISAAACDALITGSLVFHLQRQKAGVLATHGIINKLIENIISTNGLTGSVAIIDAVLFASLTSSYHVTANLCLVKLYMNSLLVSLNARSSLSAQLHPPTGHAYNTPLPNSHDHSGSHRTYNSHGAASSPAPPYGHQSPTTALGFSAAECRGIGARPGAKHVRVDVQSLVTSSETFVGSAGGHKGGGRVEGLAFVEGTTEEGKGGGEGKGHPYAMQ